MAIQRCEGHSVLDNYGCINNVVIFCERESENWILFNGHWQHAHCARYSIEIGAHGLPVPLSFDRFHVIWVKETVNMFMARDNVILPMSITQNSKPQTTVGKGITNEDNKKWLKKKMEKKYREHNLFCLVAAQEIRNKLFTIGFDSWRIRRRRFPLHLMKILVVRQSEENNLFYEIYSIRSEIESIANCIRWNWCLFLSLHLLRIVHSAIAILHWILP